MGTSQKLLWIFLTVFLTLAFFVNRYGYSIKQDPCYVARAVEDRLTPILSELTEEMDRFTFQGKDFSRIESDSKNTHKFHLFYFQDQRLQYWTDFKIVIPYFLLPQKDGMSFLVYKGSQFIVTRKSFDEGRVLFGLVQLYQQFPFENQYLKSGFNEVIFPGQSFDLYQSRTENQVSYKGHYLFSIHGSEGTEWVPVYINWLTIILYFVSLACMVILLVIYAAKIVRKGFFLPGLVFLLLGLLAVRGIMILREFPNRVINVRLFDPKYFTEGPINPSLGDLFLNLLCVLLVVLFVLRCLKYATLFKNFTASTSIALWTVVLAIYTTLSLIAFRYLYDNLRNIMNNSQIQLDIAESISFDVLRMVALAIFFITAVIFFFVQYLNFKFLKKLQKKSTIAVGIALGASLTLYNFYNTKYFWVFALLLALYWLLSVNFRTIRFLGRLRYTTFLYLFLTAMVTSMLGSFAIYKQFEFDEEIEKKKFANNLLVERDIMGEYLLSGMIERMKSNDYLASRMYSEKLADKVSETINKNYLVDYFDRFHGKVHLFREDGRPFIQNEFPLELDEFMQMNLGNGGKTDNPNIFYVRRTGVQDLYFVKVPIERFNRLLGTIVIELTLKRYVSRSVYSELLVENKYSGASSTKFDYAYFEDGRVLMIVGNFNYQSNFDIRYFQEEKLYGSGVEDNGYHHLGVKTNSGKLIVITSPNYEFSSGLSNFSFFFLIQVVGIALIMLVYRYIFSRGKAEFYFSTKIQFYLGAAFLLPLLIVSVAILNSLNNSYKEEIDKSYQKKASTIEESINGSLEQLFAGKINTEELGLLLSNISEVVENEVYVYDTNGELKAVSQPQIYELDILSKKINPQVMLEIIHNNKERVVLDESIGKLDYKTSYISVKDTRTNNLIGLMGMPFFGSKNHLKRQQVDVFTNLINIFILIFIVSLVVSYFAAKILTDPLKLLTQKIKKISFSNLNQPLEYDSKDEIGILVDEYNQMLRKFEESKIALAKSEKEAAWKKIAQQVAHEIKNPLTPMKLTLQQMQRVIDEDDPSRRSIGNLLHQVDTLSDIATSFSAFAKMPVPESEPFDIVAELKKSVQLFENEKGEIRTDFRAQEQHVLGDAKLTCRIFNNLVINALQSVPDGREPLVDISLSVSESKVKIKIADNGSGIPEEFHNKIFIPNFSTKVKGSGIGLAISKRGIEHAGGDIWFETSENGTTFYIDWPRYSV